MEGGCRQGSWGPLTAGAGLWHLCHRFPLDHQLHPGGGWRPGTCILVKETDPRLTNRETSPDKLEAGHAGEKCDGSGWELALL